MSVSINGINHAVAMATDDLDDFAIGFCLARGSGATTMYTISRAPVRARHRARCHHRQPLSGNVGQRKRCLAVPAAVASAGGEAIEHALPVADPRPVRHRLFAGSARAHRPLAGKARQSGAFMPPWRWMIAADLACRRT